MNGESPWELARTPEVVPRFLSVRLAEIQQRGGRSRCRRERDDPAPLSAEVVRPLIGSRIKQRDDSFGLGVHRSNVGSLQPVALDAGKSQVFKGGLPPVLGGNDVIGLMSEESQALGHPAVFASAASPFSYSGAKGRGNPRRAHAAPELCASTSAFMREMNRSSSHISSSSASSSGVSAPSWFRPSSSCARKEICSEGRNWRISSVAGRRAKKEMTSRRRLEVPDQLRRNPRAIISASRSRWGSSCLANLSGISIVNCITPSLTCPGSVVKRQSSRFVVATLRGQNRLCEPAIVVLGLRVWCGPKLARDFCDCATPHRRNADRLRFSQNSLSQFTLLRQRQASELLQDFCGDCTHQPILCGSSAIGNRESANRKVDSSQALKSEGNSPRTSNRT